MCSATQAVTKTEKSLSPFCRHAPFFRSHFMPVKLQMLVRVHAHMQDTYDLNGRSDFIVDRMTTTVRRTFWRDA